MNSKNFSEAMNKLEDKYITEAITVFDKGIIINHNKNRANLH